MIIFFLTLKKFKVGMRAGGGGGNMGHKIALQCLKKKLMTFNRQSNVKYFLLMYFDKKFYIFFLSNCYLNIN